MLKKSYRLSTKEFLEVMEKGRVHASPLLLVRTLAMHGGGRKGKEEESKERGGVKIAAVAPKKVASTAVLRNLLRRRMYEAVQPMLSSIIPGTHAIIFAKHETVKASFKDISAGMKALFSKAKISV